MTLVFELLVINIIFSKVTSLMNLSSFDQKLTEANVISTKNYEID